MLTNNFFSVKKRLDRSYKYLALLIGISMLSATSVMARIGIDVKTEYPSFIRYEPIEVTVTMTNYTGNVLDFGTKDNPSGHLKLIIKGNSAGAQQVVRKTGVTAGLKFEAGSTRQISFQINNMYNFQQTSTYSLKAQVGHKRLKYDYQSDTKRFDVRSGIKIWNNEVGVPDGGNSDQIAKREYTLLRVHFSKDDIYALRVEDDNHVYNVFRLGKFIYGGKPECEVDAVSNLHILKRVKSNLFVYRVFNCSGEQMERTFYVTSQNRPELYREDESGTVSVIGGREAVKGQDYVLAPDSHAVAKEIPSSLRTNNPGSSSKESENTPGKIREQK